MKNACLGLLLLISVSGSAQTMLKEEFPPIQSRKYSWKNPLEKDGKNLLTSVLFQGQGHDMEYLQVSSCELHSAKKKTLQQVPANEEHLILIRSGRLNISFKDSTWSLTPGSIALLMP